MATLADDFAEHFFQCCRNGTDTHAVKIAMTRVRPSPAVPRILQAVVKCRYPVSIDSVSRKLRCPAAGPLVKWRNASRGP